VPCDDPASCVRSGWGSRFVDQEQYLTPANFTFTFVAIPNIALTTIFQESNMNENNRPGSQLVLKVAGLCIIAALLSVGAALRHREHGLSSMMPRHDSKSVPQIISP
jgi:hypothetical protein